MAHTLTVGTPYMVQKWLEVYARRSNKPVIPYTQELQEEIDKLIEGQLNKWKPIDEYVRRLYGLPPYVS